jgi:hypothetical protein
MLLKVPVFFINPININVVLKLKSAFVPSLRNLPAYIQLYASFLPELTSASLGEYITTKILNIHLWKPFSVYYDEETKKKSNHVPGSITFGSGMYSKNAVKDDAILENSKETPYRNSFYLDSYYHNPTSPGFSKNLYVNYNEGNSEKYKNLVEQYKDLCRDDAFINPLAFRDLLLEDVFFMNSVKNRNVLFMVNIKDLYLFDVYVF